MAEVKKTFWENSVYWKILDSLEFWIRIAQYLLIRKLTFQNSNFVTKITDKTLVHDICFLLTPFFNYDGQSS